MLCDALERDLGAFQAIAILLVDIEESTPLINGIILLALCTADSLNRKLVYQVCEIILL